MATRAINMAELQRGFLLMGHRERMALVGILVGGGLSTFMRAVSVLAVSAGTGLAVGVVSMFMTEDLQEHWHSVFIILEGAVTLGSMVVLHGFLKREAYAYKDYVWSLVAARMEEALHNQAHHHHVRASGGPLTSSAASPLHVRPTPPIRAPEKPRTPRHLIVSIGGLVAVAVMILMLSFHLLHVIT